MLKFEDDRRNINETVVWFKFNPVRHARKIDYFYFLFLMQQATLQGMQVIQF